MRAPLLAALLATACGSSSSSPPAKTPTPPPPAKEPAGPPVLDEGSLKITIGGKDAGEETFKVTGVAGGEKTMSSHASWHVAGKDLDVTSTMVVDGQNHPHSGTFKVANKDASVAMTLSLKDGVLELASSAGKEPVKDQGGSDVFIHDRVLSHLQPLCAVGPEAEGEKKELKAFPGVPLEIGPGTRFEAEGRSLEHHPVIVAGMTSFEIVCEGDKLVLISERRGSLIAVRPGLEQLASSIQRRIGLRKPAIPAGLQELEREVHTRDNVLLGCSLLLPSERRSPLPSVVLLTGSGAQDRDEDSPDGALINMAFYKHIAIALASAGVASLRCDDRGIGKSKGTMEGMTLETMVTDAVAMVAQLRAEPGLDPKRVGIVGHSEGGAVAAMVAAGDPGVKALALLASMGRPLEEVSLDQNEDAMRKAGLPNEEIAKERAHLAKIYAAIKAGKGLPDDTRPEEKDGIMPILPWLASHFRHDPAKSFKKLKMPVLVARGDKDFQTSEKDTAYILDNLKKAGNKRVTVKKYPELSHLFAPIKTGTISDYTDPDLAVDLAFIGDVATFLQKAL